MPRLDPAPEGRGGRDSKRGDEGSHWSLPERGRRLVLDFVGVSVLHAFPWPENLKSQFAISKTNLLAGWLRWRKKERFNGAEKFFESTIMLHHGPLDLSQTTGQNLGGRKRLSQSNKGLDQSDTHFNGLWTVENIGGHQCAVLGEGTGQEPHVAFRGCGHSL